MFKLKLASEMGGAEADPLTEMLVLEELAYHDLTSGWCTMVGATAIASLGTFLPQSGLDKVFSNGHVPSASISFFPAGQATRNDNGGYRVSGRWRFNSGIRHAEWVLGGTVVLNSDNGNGGPIVMFSAFPAKDMTLYDNWGGVTGLRGTGSVDFSVQDYELPEDQTFVWDLLEPQPLRGGAVLPAAALQLCRQGTRQRGAGRRAARTRRTGEDRHHDTGHVPVLQARRTAGGASLHRRSRSEIAGGARADARALRPALAQGECRRDKPDGPDIADVRAICVYATDVAIEIATMAYHFAGNTGLHHPHVIGRLLRDINTAGIHQVMSDTAYENHGKFRLGLPADPLA